MKQAGGAAWVSPMEEKMNMADVEKFLASDKAKVLACGTCLAIRKQESNEKCPEGKLEDFYNLVAENDKVLTF